MRKIYIYSIKIDWQVYQQVSEWYSWVNKYLYAFEKNIVLHTNIIFLLLIFFSRIIYFFLKRNEYFLYSFLFVKTSMIFGFLKTIIFISFYFSLYLSKLFDFDQYSRLNYFRSSALLVSAFLFEMKYFVLFNLD